jgi:CP family cyanate transporter-like MFS transporter
MRMRPLARSPLALALALFFGLQSLEAYVMFGWVAQYLRDSGLSAATAGLLLGINTLVGIPLSAVAAPLTVRPGMQRPMVVAFVVCYVGGWVGLWVAPTTVPVVWMLLLAVGMASFPMVLALIGLRARTAETTTALSTFTQSWGYVGAGFGPLLVGILRGATGGYTGMFVLLLAGVAGLGVSGWFVTRQRYVDDEVDLVPAAPSAGERDLIEVAGDEPPVVVHVREQGAGSPRG